MNTTSFPLVPNQPSDKLLYCIFSQDKEMSLPENSSLQECQINLQLDATHITSSIPYGDNQGIALNNYANYGTVCGVYWLWKNVHFPYIGFSLTNTILDPSKKELESFIRSSKDLCILQPQPCNAPLQENYRSLYYGYDFRMLLSILKKHAPAYYTFAKENWVSSNDFIQPTCIIKENVFRKFCAWIFPILEHCYKHIPQKHSKHQNRFLEHLTYYLFMLYIKFHEKNLNIQYNENYTHLAKATETPPKSFTFPGLKEYIQHLLDMGDIEVAYKHLSENKDLTEAQKLLPIFEKYEKERRYHKTTLFEETHQLDELLNKLPQTPNLQDRKPRVLIFEWNSITHKESLWAFEALGFEYHTFKTPYKSWIYDEDFLEQINRHLDFYSYDMVFSVNYFAMVAEACYSHDTPYVAWCYDSPTYIGSLRYLKYPTNHVFLFDSTETQEYITRGCTNVYHMPLAVNVERLDNIKCSPEDIAKYQASISFVGALYDTKLITALNYLPDYKKAYLNALVDNQMHQYNHDLYANILSTDFMEWISQPDFNKAIQSEWEKDKPRTDTPSAGSLNILLKKMVTNRERLLMITMLSKHWDFKLYSSSTNEVFNNVIQCGTIEYYEEMPKAFRNSRINLNVTFRTIRTGIPQRCLDVIGSHGLLLTNHQKDLDEYFKDEENLLLYHSFEEAYDKTKFYLEHETERKRIENNGYETVRKYFNYPEVLKRILHISNLDYLLK